MIKPRGSVPDPVGTEGAVTPEAPSSTDERPSSALPGKIGSGPGALSRFGVAPSLVAIILGSLFVYYYLIPVSLKFGLSWTIAGARVFPVELGLLVLPLVSRRLEDPWMFAWALAGMAWGAISVLLSPYAGSEGIYAVLEVYLPFAVVAWVPASATYVRPLRVVAGAVVVCLSAEVVVFSTGLLSYGRPLGLEISDGYVRITTTAGAATAAGAILFLLGVWAVDAWRERRMVALGLGVVAAMGALATLSRSPVAMAAGTALVWAALALYRRRARLAIRRRSLRAVAAGAIVVAVSVVVAGSLGLPQAFLARLDEWQESNELREERFGDALRRADDRPVLGLGPGAYLKPQRVVEPTFPGLGPTAPHNSYLLVLVEWGVLGVGWFLGGLLALTARSFVRRPALVGTAALVPILAIGFNTETVYLQPQVSLLLAMILGMTGAARRTAVPRAHD